MQASSPLTTKKPAGLFSPTILSLQVSGWLVFACLWLPLCKGCSGGADKIPVHLLRPMPAGGVEALFSNFMLLGSYCNGLFVAMSMAFVAWIASERLWRSLFLVQFGMTFAMATLMVIIGMIQCSNAKGLLGNFLFTVPTLAACAVWIAIAIRRRDFQRAWARVQHAWTIAALFIVHILILFEGAVLYGYWITLVGQAGMTVAVEVAAYRMKHDLWDASQKVTRPQFSIRTILIWTAFFPLAFSYYRAIEPLCNWIFRQP